jgi:hypothetical protein
VCCGTTFADWTTGVQSPAQANNFSSSLCVQTGCGAHLASCTMATEGPFPGGKPRPERDTDHSPLIVPRSRMSRSCISCPPLRLHEGSGTALLLLLSKRKLFYSVMENYPLTFMKLYRVKSQDVPACCPSCRDGCIVRLGTNQRQ